jgi:hypothetical protein
MGAETSPSSAGTTAAGRAGHLTRPHHPAPHAGPTRPREEQRRFVPVRGRRRPGRHLHGDAPADGTLSLPVKRTDVLVVHSASSAGHKINNPGRLDGDNIVPDASVTDSRAIEFWGDAERPSTPLSVRRSSVEIPTRNRRRHRDLCVRHWNRLMWFRGPRFKSCPRYQSGPESSAIPGLKASGN